MQINVGLSNCRCAGTIQQVAQVLPRAFPLPSTFKTLSQGPCLATNGCFRTSRKTHRMARRGREQMDRFRWKAAAALKAGGRQLCASVSPFGCRDGEQDSDHCLTPATDTREPSMSTMDGRTGPPDNPTADRSTVLDKSCVGRLPGVANIASAVEEPGHEQRHDWPSNTAAAPCRPSTLSTRPRPARRQNR